MYGRKTEKMEIICPNCSEKGEVLWFPWEFGKTGSQKNEKVEGTCKNCGYKFKVDDLD